MNLYKDNQGVMRQTITGNYFRIRVYDDCAEVVFVVGRSDVAIATFDSVQEADRAYDSIVSHAVTVDDAITMIRERA